MFHAPMNDVQSGWIRKRVVFLMELKKSNMKVNQSSMPMRKFWSAFVKMRNDRRSKETERYLSCEAKLKQMMTVEPVGEAR